MGTHFSCNRLPFLTTRISFKILNLSFLDYKKRIKKLKITNYFITTRNKIRIETNVIAPLSYSRRMAKRNSSFDIELIWAKEKVFAIAAHSFWKKCGLHENNALLRRDIIEFTWRFLYFRHMNPFLKYSGESKISFVIRNILFCEMVKNI